MNEKMVANYEAKQIAQDALTTGINNTAQSSILKQQQEEHETQITELSNAKEELEKKFCISNGKNSRIQMERT